MAHSKPVSRQDSEATSLFELLPNERQRKFAELIVGNVQRGLGGLPLALVHAASFFRRKGTEDCFEEYWQLLQQNSALLQVKPESVEEWLKQYRLRHLFHQLTEMGVHRLQDPQEFHPNEKEVTELASSYIKKLLWLFKI